jgi:ribosomal protein S18 acetylase RimI-like enzyme
MLASIEISPATEKDITSIVTINNEFITSLGPDGFLVVPYDIESLTQNITRGEISFFIARDLHSAIRGYVGFAKSFDINLMKEMSWNSSEDKELFISIVQNPHIYIKQVAVTKDFQRLSIGKSLYTYLENLGFPLIVFVAERPVLNKTSLDFHIALGYKQVGRIHRDEFGRLQDYHSICFVRK